MFDHRLQILLDEQRFRKVSMEAERRGVSVAAVIREAIDHLPPSLDQRRRAIDAILAMEPVPMPDDPHDLRHEIDEEIERKFKC